MYDREKVDGFIDRAEKIAKKRNTDEAFKAISSEIDECEPRYLNDYIQALNFIRTEKSLDWIENNAHRIINVSNHWGHVAAISFFTWERADKWLTLGRPLSLVALDALLMCTANGERSHFSLMIQELNPRLGDDPKPEIVASRLQEYLLIDNKMRTRESVQKIISNVFETNTTAPKKSHSSASSDQPLIVPEKQPASPDKTMTPAEVYKQVLNKIEWLVAIANRKQWTIRTKPFVGPPAELEEINTVENRIGLAIPADLKKLFQFSRHLEFGYQFDEEMPEEFRQNFSGEIYWNLDTLAEQQQDFQESLQAFIDPQYMDPEDFAIAEELWRGKLSLIHVPNGDTISVGNNPSEVIYFSHEGDTMHGKILGKDLWSFLDFYSRIGFAGSEDWQLEPFYDFENDRMTTQGEKIDRYIRLLEN